MVLLPGFFRSFHAPEKKNNIKKTQAATRSASAFAGCNNGHNEIRNKTTPSPKSLITGAKPKTRHFFIFEIGGRVVLKKGWREALK